MKKILLVDDNAASLAIVSGILKNQYKVYPVDSGKDALLLLEKHTPDLILLDVDMPNMSGIELMGIIKSKNHLSSIPVIFITSMSDTDNEARAFDLGAVDYIHKPVNSIVLLARVKLHLELEAFRKELQALVAIKTSEILHLQRITIELLGCVNEYRDEETGNHVKRTVGYVTAIMDNLPDDLPPSYHISKTYYDDIIKSTPLHDIGKISIPDSILLKPDKLTNDEFEIMKTHVTSGGEILQSAIKDFNGFSFLDVALEIVMSHHEKWNGTGYPNHLAGEDIPLSGRIMAVADVYDALTSKRPYKPPFPHEKAVSIISESSGTHFDPVLVDVFLDIQDKILEIATLYKE